MAVELGKFISNQLDSLPADHPDRTLIEGVSVVVEAYLAKNETLLEAPKSTLPTRGESIQFASELPLTTRGKGVTANLFRLGKISTAQDLCHIPDYDLKMFYHVGEKTVANIRKFYPYILKKNNSEED